MKRRRTREDRKKLGTGIAAVMVSLSSFAVYKAVAETVTMPVIARLIRNIEVTLHASLDFGTLAMTADRAGVATIDPFGDKLTIDNNSSLSPAGGEPRAGRIRIKGATKPITVSVDQQTIQLTNGTTFISVNNFNFGAVDGGSRVTITPTGTGDTMIVDVGASLNTKPGQLTGTYVGANRIFANFQ